LQRILIYDENKDESLEDLENLPAPDILARKIADNLGNNRDSYFHEVKIIKKIVSLESMNSK
jgi:hypothetical protein